MMIINLDTNTVTDLQGVSLFGLDPMTRAFITRVEADGGVVEAPGCIRKRLYPLMGYSATASWLAFETRVVADGGTAEAETCVIAALESLT